MRLPAVTLAMMAYYTQLAYLESTFPEKYGTEEEVRERLGETEKDDEGDYLTSLPEDWIGPLPDWENAPAWERDAYVRLATFVNESPNAEPEDIHSNWMMAMASAGWHLGVEFDEAGRAHPDLLPYDQLSTSLKWRYVALKALVNAAADLKDTAAEPPTSL